MFGNPFNYASWSNQESLIDISSFPYPIQGINVFFFQSKVLNQNIPFIDYQLRTIPYQITYPDLDRPVGEEPDLFDNNLFVDNINLYFGDLTTNFKDHELVLYTPSSLKYSEDVEENKELKVRWILNETPDAEVATLISVDELEEEIKNWTIDNSLPIDSSYWDNKVLYLYKYTYGQNEPDPYAGDFWEPIIRWGYQNFKQEETVVDGNPIIVYKYNKNIDRITNKQFDIGQIEFLNDFANLDLESEDFTSPFNISIPLLEFDRQSALTRYKFLIVEYPLSAIEGDEYHYNYDPAARTIYSSNEVTFSNRDQVASQATMALIRGLELVCSDNSNGVYRVYDNLGHIANGARYGEKKLKANFEAINILNLNAGPVTITWKYPKNNTMLLEPSDFDEEVSWDRDVDPNWYVLTKPIDDIAETGEEDEVKSIVHSIPYSISMNYYPTRTNNTIQCIIERNGKEYIAEKEFYFGGFGSNGTNYSFDISLEKEYKYDETSDTFTTKSDELVPFIKTQNQDWVKIKASLLYNNTEITDLSAVKWSWYKKTNDKDFLIVNGMTNDSVVGSEIYIKYNRELSLDTDYDYILQAQLTYDIVRPQSGTGEETQGEQENTDKITLIAYLPIGISNDSSVITYQGDNIITYNDYGTLAFYNKEPYKLFQLNVNQIESMNNIIWKSIPLSSENTSQLTGYPDILQDGNGDWFIRPVNFFVSSIDNVCRFVASTGQSTIVFIQPILLLQDHYGNQILNDWNGKLSIDEENNTILSAIMGAGTKDNDNKFSGILMGEVDNNGTGLYGYSHGAQVYGFRDNGTAFIGPSGSGRIEFDGTKAIIQGGAYQDLQNNQIKYNTTINLEDGKIDAANFTLTAGDSNYYIGKDDEDNDITENRQIIITSNTNNGSYTTKPLKVGNKFSVDWDGTVTMSGANITDENGTSYIDLINSVTSELNLSDYVKFDTSYTNNSSSFQLASASGLLKAKNGFFSGVISAYAGDLGGWVVAPGIMSHGYNMKFYQSGNTYYWKGDFITISNQPNHSINANIDQIGGDSTNNNSRTGVGDDLGFAPANGVNVKSNGAFIYLRNNGTGITINQFGYENANQTGKSLNNIIFSLGKNFAVNQDGDIFAHNGTFSGTVNATSGTIGGWNITSKGIEYDNTTGSGSNISGPKITLDPTKGLEFLLNGTKQFAVNLSGALTAISGTIGGLQLNDGYLSKVGTVIGDINYGGMTIHPGYSSNTTTVAGNSVDNIAFQIGSRFKVLADGSIYANNGEFDGTITASQFLGQQKIREEISENYLRVWNGLYTLTANNEQKIVPFMTRGLTINNTDSDDTGFWKNSLFTKMTCFTHARNNWSSFDLKEGNKTLPVYRGFGFGLYESLVPTSDRSYNDGNAGTAGRSRWDYVSQTYNSSYMESRGYDHNTYIGFLRGAGGDSSHPSNVFFGLKSSPYIVTENGVYDNRTQNASGDIQKISNRDSTSVWNLTGDNTDKDYNRYNAWVRFNGDARFRSLTVGTSYNTTGTGNYDVGSGDWGIDHNGNAKFNNLTVQNFTNKASLAFESGSGDNTLVSATDTGSKSGPFLKLKNGNTYDERVKFVGNGMSVTGKRTSWGEIPYVELDFTIGTSDIRLKKNLKFIDNLDLYDNLTPYSFQWKETNVRTYGLIAQDIEELSKKYKNDSDDLFYMIDNTHKNYIDTEKEYCINYQAFHALHIAKNHQQDKRIAQLEQQVAELQNQIEQLLRDKGGN